MKSTISSKGQITVPAEIRRKLGLTAGTVVAFEVHEGTAVLRKGHDGKHPVDEMRGPRPTKRRPAKKRGKRKTS